MSMYIPEIKEEVSENAKMLVMEEDGKIVRTGMPKGNSEPSVTGFDVVIVHDPDSNEATLAHGDYTALREKYAKKLPILCMINNYNVNSEIHFEYPRHISFSTSDYIGVCNSGVDIEYQIYPDNHIEAWDIG